MNDSVGHCAARWSGRRATPLNGAWQTPALLVLDVQPLLAGEPGGEVGDVALGELLHLPLHDDVLALAVLVVAQHRHQVFLVLSREVGKLRAHAHAVGAVARLAGRGLLLADFGIAGSQRGSRGGEQHGAEDLRGRVHRFAPLALPPLPAVGAGTVAGAPCAGFACAGPFGVASAGARVAGAGAAAGAAEAVRAAAGAP